MRSPKPPAQAKKQVLIVDDHPLLREGLRRLIDREADLAVCGEAGTAPEALAAVAKLRPDVVVVDISLPGRDGLDLIKDLRTRHRNLKVLVLSMHDETVYAERALRAGARGYIMKREPIANHLRAIRQVLAGEIAVSSAIVTRLTTKLGNAQSLSPVDLLSDRELEVFRLLGEGRDRRSIAANLCLSVKTIESHRANIRRKLGLRSAAELLRHAAYFIRDEPPAQPAQAKS